MVDLVVEVVVDRVVALAHRRGSVRGGGTEGAACEQHAERDDEQQDGGGGNPR